MVPTAVELGLLMTGAVCCDTGMEVMLQA